MRRHEWRDQGPTEPAGAALLPQWSTRPRRTSDTIICGRAAAFRGNRLVEEVIVVSGQASALRPAATREQRMLSESSSRLQGRGLMLRYGEMPFQILSITVTPRNSVTPADLSTWTLKLAGLDARGANALVPASPRTTLRSVCVIDPAASGITSQVGASLATPPEELHEGWRDC